MNGVHKDPPIAAFEAEIAKYLAIQTEITELPSSATIGYLRVDAQPMKQALSSTVTKWIYSFTLYIQGIVSFFVASHTGFQDVDTLNPEPYYCYCG